MLVTARKISVWFYIYVALHIKPCVMTDPESKKVLIFKKIEIFRKAYSVIYTHTHTHTHIYICYVIVYVCAYVYLCRST